jgi:hypothetical protein
VQLLLAEQRQRGPAPACAEVVQYGLRYDGAIEAGLIPQRAVGR